MRHIIEGFDNDVTAFLSSSWSRAIEAVIDESLLDTRKGINK